MATANGQDRCDFGTGALCAGCGGQVDLSASKGRTEYEGRCDQVVGSQKKERKVPGSGGEFQPTVEFTTAISTRLRGSDWGGVTHLCSPNLEAFWRI